MFIIPVRHSKSEEKSNVRPSYRLFNNRSTFLQIAPHSKKNDGWMIMLIMLHQAAYVMHTPCIVFYRVEPYRQTLTHPATCLTISNCFSEMQR